MNEYTQRQLEKLEEYVQRRKAARKKGTERFMQSIRKESDSSVIMLGSVIIYVLFLLGLVLLAVLVVSCNPAHAEEIDIQKYVNAIYKAEGGDKAQYPYGIRSVKCSTKAECRKIAENTVRNNIKRYREYGHKTHATYLEFLASRYAPIGASNDPKNLNSNWLRNVRYFLGGA